MTESPQWLFMESSWKTKSIRLGTPSHRYWLAVSDYEVRWSGWGGVGGVGGGGVRERHGQGSEEREWVGKEKTGRGRMFWCFCNSQTSVRCRCLWGMSAAPFSDDRGRSQKEAGCYKPQQCTECVKTLQSKNNVTAMHCSPVSLYNGITASLV